jgi:hypothetical protein
MTVRRITDPERYIGLSTDEKPSVPTIGSTYEASDTGDKFKYNGVDWEEDFDSIVAIEMLEKILASLQVQNTPLRSTGNKTADCLIVNGSGVLKDILINTDGTNDAALVIYDGVSAAGNVVWEGSVIGANKTGFAQVNRKFNYGLYADMTVGGGGTMKFNVGYLKAEDLSI